MLKMHRNLKILILVCALSCGVYGQPPNPPPIPPNVCNRPHPPPNCPQVPLSDWFMGIVVVSTLIFIHRRFKNLENDNGEI